MTRIIVIIACFLLCSFNYESGGEKIYSFHSDIQIQKNGSVVVTEKIEVRALGVEIRKGIYRDIPLNYKLPEGVIRQSLKVNKVLRNGKTEPYNTEMIEGGIRIYIGSPNSNVPIGTQRYELTYELDRTVYCSEERCKVMWNVNGNHWDFTIDTLSATISTPENTRVLSFDGWTGKYRDANENSFTSKSLSEGKQVFMSNRLNPGENLTIAVEFTKDVITEASLSTKMIYFFRDYSIPIIGGFGFLLSFLINFILWSKYGKDPRKGTIIPQFYAPEGWSPPEVLFLLNEGKVDKNMFASQLLQLAVKGHIKIEKKNTKSKKDEFVITSTAESTKKQELTKLEKGFLNELLGTKDSIEMSNKYNENVAAAHNYQITEIEKIQSGLYFNKNTKLILPQYIFPVFTIIAMTTAYNYFEGPVWLIPLLAVLMIVMNVVFLRLFYQPTKEGRKVLDHILGLERYIKYADELRINAVNKPDMNFDYYEKNLPYAIALGKANEWGEKFRVEDIEPQYKVSNYYIQGSSFRNLAYFGALSSVSSVAAAPPSSAGSSGGGFSGGGFSGGGAGGGGGGGW